MKSYCIICDRLQNQIVLKSIIKEYQGTEQEGGWWDKSGFQIIKCGGCDEISFRKLYNDVAMQGNSKDDETIQELYPQRGSHSRPIKVFRGVPIEITKIYRETIDAFNSNLKLLCSVGVRAIVEAICLDKKIVNGEVKSPNGEVLISKKLDGKISGMATKGFLTSDNAETLHEIRFIGNEAIHELTQPSLEELRLAIDIVELVIENIYIVKRKALHLQQRRENRKNE